LPAEPAICLKGCDSIGYFEEPFQPATHDISVRLLLHCGFARETSISMTSKTATPLRHARSRRSALYVPANNVRALAKIGDLAADSYIIDLEDSVSPDDKETARRSLTDYFSGAPEVHGERVIRVNAPDTPWGEADLAAAVACRPDAVLMPKISSPQDILDVEAKLASLDAPESLRIWAMIETPAGIARCRHISEAALERPARLDCLVAGTNDLAKDTGTALTSDRAFLAPWLLEIVLCARFAGLDALDGVSNEFRDAERIAAECRQGRQMGFDGKTLIHPNQIGPANSEFGVSAQDIAAARRIVDAFSAPEHAGKGVISLNGKMVERLHLQQAEALLAKASLQET